MDVCLATHRYEAWLSEFTPLHQSDLDHKHKQMADRHDPFPFFRGTYYLWARHWLAEAGELATAPRVLAVGDLHLENYGTWRDFDGRLVWGINDFDEADQLPYTQDLVRLVASVRFACLAGVLNIRTRTAAAAILQGYRQTLAAAGTPFVLEERYRKIRALGMIKNREPARFWSKLTSLLCAPAVEPPEHVRAALCSQLPDPSLKMEYRFRPKVGMGSLGKPRYVALVEWKKSWIAREAKAVAPPATAWAGGRSEVPSQAAEAVGRAIRSPDPFYHPGKEWVVRRLAPRCSRIELDHLEQAGDLVRLLRAMGSETANVHLGTPAVSTVIQKDLLERPQGWLAQAARSFAMLVKRDWVEWRKARRRG